MIELRYFGEILKPFRNEGYLMASTVNLQSIKKKCLDWIFIEINGNRVPYAVEEIYQEENTVFIKFKDFSHVEDVKKNNGNFLFLPIECFKKEIKLNLQELTGYKLIDITSGIETEIVKIVEYPFQLMAFVNVEHKEVLVPLAEALVKKIDPDNKKIEMNLPEGIFDLKL